MKKTILVCLLFAGLGLLSCNTNSPKAVADKFLNSFYHLDYENARKLSTDDTKKMLDMWQELLVMLPDSAKQTAKKIKVSIKNVDQSGDKAIVKYATSENPKEQTLHMVKLKGKWLAQWTKQDQMAGEDNTDTANGNNPPVGPAANDSAAGTPEKTPPMADSSKTK